MYLGELLDGGTHDFKFTTVDTGGAPFTLAGSPVLSVYKDNSTTETTTGPTLTVDFDTLTGCNHVRLVLTDAFYVADTDYQVVITTGTVDGVSVVGYVVAEFSIQNRGVDWGNIQRPTTTVDLSGTDIQLVDTVTTYTGDTPQTGDNFARIGVNGAGLSNIDLPNQTMDITGNLSGSVGSVTGAVGSVSALAANVITAASINAAAMDGKGDWLPPTNIALDNIYFMFVAASDHVTPVTGATGAAVTRSIDGSSFGAGTGTIAEIGNGIYQYDASAADVNGTDIILRFTGTGGTPGAPDDSLVVLRMSA